ncbi:MULTISPECIES: aminotransferase class V-fold PLP-dependent enzyme [unclassified Leucobacter]|uniref:aminotransferase class V-fold PLP-dependent enzyme n=1 Tax=unclassified Leucobacter TaxID=2621730 RepID=UPI00165EA186|nr:MULTISPECIES: aminotransferase class V-fold PLP-dependent enzyme [unclassified Leucobacter]MBC9936884.1 aminotransferase class V-fold PLP-dependent enzyme [Leucobacter sp. cx-87]
MTRAFALPAAHADAFLAGPGYLAACTTGLPIRATVDAVTASLAQWAAGELDLNAAAAQVERSRALFADLVGVTPEQVSVGSQVSSLAAIVAASLPPGARVLAAADDFASLTHPFEQQAHRGVRVTYVPVAQLADAVEADTDVVVFSLVQSATGEIADGAAIAEAARRVGARTVVDTTQAAGWLPHDASRFDVTLCHAYKWLLSPRGTAFMTVLDPSWLVPIAAGWCSADDVWGSCYAGHTPLSESAKRFDVSPAWQAWAGTVPALEFVSSLDLEAVRAHNVGLANALAAGLGLPETNSAIVAWADADGSALAKLQAAGITASGRAGRARVAFHVWNSLDDVKLALTAIRG